MARHPARGETHRETKVTTKGDGPAGPPTRRAAQTQRARGACTDARGEDHRVTASAVSSAQATDRRDRTRQVAVLLGSLLAVAGAFLGSGALGGTPIAEAAGGALSADATHLAPGSPAFSIWSVVYTGLVAGAVRQALPAQRRDPRQRRLGWWVLASMVLNAVWIGVVQAGAVALRVVVIVALLATLAVVLVRMGERPPSGRVERLVVDGTLGLYLGWVSVATAANVAAALASAGLTEPPGGPDVWAVLVLAVVALLGLVVARYSGGRLGIALAMAWGLIWIAVARLTDEPSSPTTAVAAALAAGVVLGSAVLVRARRSPERAAGGPQR